jgi:DNA processing protein
VIAAVLALSDHDLIAAVAGSARPAAERLLETFDAAAARASLDRTRSEAVCRHATGFPKRVTQLHDPPNPLYVRGGLERLTRLAAQPAVAIVGGRRPSEYARGVARELGRDLAAAGVTVVSGLALGIDGESHRGALDGGGAPVAVLAGGPDYIYPRCHAALYRRVVERGVVVSELPPGTEPRKWAFPARNRIMVGFAEAVVVVEAREASGSLITADFALQARRSFAGRRTSSTSSTESAAAPAPARRRSHCGRNCGRSSTPSRWGRACPPRAPGRGSRRAICALRSAGSRRSGS